jgi:hypothetical protein
MSLDCAATGLFADNLSLDPCRPTKRTLSRSSVNRTLLPNRSALECRDIWPWQKIFLTFIRLGLAEDTAQSYHCGVKIIDRRAARFVLSRIAEHEFMRDLRGKLGSGQAVAVSSALPLVCNHSAARAGGIAIEQVGNFLECQPQLGHGRLPPSLG